MTDARTKRDAAIRQVEENCDAAWMGEAFDAVRFAAEHRPEVTSDDAWLILASWNDWGLLNAPVHPHNPRAMGPVFCRAKREGLIERTDRTVQSKRRACNAREIRVWRSLVYAQDQAA